MVEIIIPSNDSEKLLAIGKDYLSLELCPLPTVPGEKRPALSTWTQYQTRRPTGQELKEFFATAGDNAGIGIICGSVSGGLEVLDFDNGGSAFGRWKAGIPPELFNKLIIERTPSGGFHCYYRAPNIEGSKKLAMTQDDKTTIETRGKGGFVKCSPSDGYELIQGSFYSLPMLTADERETLIESARALNEKEQKQPEPAQMKPEQTRHQYNGESPADAYTQQTNVVELLQAHGWENPKPAADGNIHLTRPGKDGGTSGTVKVINGVQIFFPFTTSTEFEAGRGYNAFQIYSIYKHAGDQSAAARELLRQGYGSSQRQDGADSGNVDTGAIDIALISQHRARDTWEPMPIDCLPERTRRFATAAARALNVDPASVAFSLLVTAGATIGARLKIRLGGLNWSGAPILWGALVAPSAMGKSPTMKIGLELLKDKKREFLERYEMEMKEFQKVFERYKTSVKKIFRLEEKIIDAETDGDSETVQKCKEQIEKYKRHELYQNPPKRPTERIIDISGAFSLPGLVDKAAENPMGYLIFQDELTQLFKSLEDNSQVGASGELLSFFDGSGSRTALKTQELNRSAGSCWAAILGGIVPDNLKRYIGGTEKQSDGFLARFLLVFSPSIPLEEYDPGAYLDDKSAEYKDMKAIMEALADYSPNVSMGADGNAFISPRYATLSKEAKAAFNEARRQIREQQLNSVDDLEISLLGKSENILARLTLLLFILESAEAALFDADANMPEELEGFTETTEIPLDTFQRAKKLTRWLIAETRSVYKLTGFIKESDLEFIAKRLKESGGATLNQIAHWRSRWKEKDSDGRRELEHLLEAGIKKGLWKASSITGANNQMSVTYTAIK